MNEPTTKPLVGVPACVRERSGLVYHEAGDKYVRAVAQAAGAQPLIIPSLEDEIDVPNLVRQLDGVLMTGSPSNVHPECYGRAASPEAEPYDVARDSVSLPLIQEALHQGVPLFAICRGFQELNVALGGTLHPRLHELPGRRDHRRPQVPDLAEQYGPRHSVRLVEGGVFASLLGVTELSVNSLHWQGIDRLAERLMAEGTAEDGTIEAVRVEAATGFALGVQWHPEYAVMDPANRLNRVLFGAFGEAAAARAKARRMGEAAVAA
jgi:putative glutamine amidotransferase